MNKKITILPASVIDIAPQAKSIRKDGNFEDSSRKVMSNHPEETSILVYELYGRDKTRVFDPFAGFGQRGYWAKHYGFDYVGYDISQANVDHAKSKFGVDNFLRDSSVAPLPEFFDLVYTCPPYWNLEVYEGDEGLDKIKTWDNFKEFYSDLWRRIIWKAPKGTRFCVQVGDWRSKGKYYDLVHVTECAFRVFGLTPFDKVVLSRKKITKLKVMLPQAIRLGYSVKCHETLLVYEK